MFTYTAEQYKNEYDSPNLAAEHQANQHNAVKLLPVANHRQPTIL